MRRRSHGMLDVLAEEGSQFFPLPVAAAVVCCAGLCAGLLLMAQRRGRGMCSMQERVQDAKKWLKDVFDSNGSTLQPCYTSKPNSDPYTSHYFQVGKRGFCNQAGVDVEGGIDFDLDGAERTESGCRPTQPGETPDAHVTGLAGMMVHQMVHQIHQPKRGPVRRVSVYRSQQLPMASMPTPQDTHGRHGNDTVSNPYLPRPGLTTVTTTNNSSDTAMGMGMNSASQVQQSQGHDPSTIKAAVDQSLANIKCKKWGVAARVVAADVRSGPVPRGTSTKVFSASEAFIDAPANRDGADVNAEADAHVATTSSEACRLGNIPDTRPLLEAASHPSHLHSGDNERDCNEYRESRWGVGNPSPSDAGVGPGRQRRHHDSGGQHDCHITPSQQLPHQLTMPTVGASTLLGSAGSAAGIGTKGSATTAAQAQHRRDHQEQPFGHHDGHAGASLRQGSSLLPGQGVDIPSPWVGGWGAGGADSGCVAQGVPSEEAMPPYVPPPKFSKQGSFGQAKHRRVKSRSFSSDDHANTPVSPNPNVSKDATFTVGAMGGGAGDVRGGGGRQATHPGAESLSPRDNGPRGLGKRFLGPSHNPNPNPRPLPLPLPPPLPVPLPPPQRESGNVEGFQQTNPPLVPVNAHGHTMVLHPTPPPSTSASQGLEGGLDSACNYGAPPVTPPTESLSGETQRVAGSTGVTAYRSRGDRDKPRGSDRSKDSGGNEQHYHNKNRNRKQVGQDAVSPSRVMRHCFEKSVSHRKGRGGGGQTGGVRFKEMHRQGVERQERQEVQSFGGAVSWEKGALAHQDQASRSTRISRSRKQNSPGQSITATTYTHHQASLDRPDLHKGGTVTLMTPQLEVGTLGTPEYPLTAGNISRKVAPSSSYQTSETCNHLSTAAWGGGGEAGGAHMQTCQQEQDQQLTLHPNLLSDIELGIEMGHQQHGRRHPQELQQDHQCEPGQGVGFGVGVGLWEQDALNESAEEPGNWELWEESVMGGEELGGSKDRDWDLGGSRLGLRPHSSWEGSLMEGSLMTNKSGKTSDALVNPNPVPGDHGCSPDHNLKPNPNPKVNECSLWAYPWSGSEGGEREKEGQDCGDDSCSDTLRSASKALERDDERQPLELGLGSSFPNPKLRSPTRAVWVGGEDDPDQTCVDIEGGVGVRIGVEEGEERGPTTPLSCGVGQRTPPSSDPRSSDPSVAETDSDKSGTSTDTSTGTGSEVGVGLKCSAPIYDRNHNLLAGDRAWDVGGDVGGEGRKVRDKGDRAREQSGAPEQGDNIDGAGVSWRRELGLGNGRHQQGFREVKGWAKERTGWTGRTGKRPTHRRRASEIVNATTDMVNPMSVIKEVPLSEADVGARPQGRDSLGQTSLFRAVRSGRDLSSAAAAAANLDLDFEEVGLKKTIGGGGFGQVYQGCWRGTTVAVKVLLPIAQSDLDDDTWVDFLAEVEMLAGLRHPNICLFMGACITPPNRAIITEMVSRGSLWDALRDNHMPEDIIGAGIAGLHSGTDITDTMRPRHRAPIGCWPWWLIMRVAEGTACGMNYLHRHQPPILHRDLKSANLLLDDSYTVKICDFGLARLKAFSNSMTGNCGTVQWMAPEVLSYDKYTETADVYSFGIVCWELLSRMCPYEGMSQIQVAVAVLNKGLRPSIPDWCTQEFRSLIEASWQQDPSRRPSFEQVLGSVRHQAIPPPSPLGV